MGVGCEDMKTKEGYAAGGGCRNETADILYIWHVHLLTYYTRTYVHGAIPYRPRSIRYCAMDTYYYRDCTDESDVG